MRWMLGCLLCFQMAYANHCQTACCCCGKEDPVQAVMELIAKISGDECEDCLPLTHEVETKLAQLFKCSGIEACPSCTIRQTVLGILQESHECCEHNLHQALEETVPLTSEMGRRLLKESPYQRDLLPLLEQFEVQQEGWWCGVATATMVLNALPIERAESKYANYRLFTQERFFDDPIARQMGLEPDNRQGIALYQLHTVLNGKDQVECEIFPMEELRLNEFRQHVIEALEDDHAYLMVNYSRSVANQGEGAHFSPVAAYHPGVDAVLILDTAKFKYSPFWMPVQLICEAMHTSDSLDPSIYRGYLVVSKSSL